MATSSLIIGFILVSVIVALWRRWGKAPLPPVFRTKPASGARKPWEAYAEGARTLGSIMTVSSFPRMIVVVNTIEAVTDLFDKRVSFANRARWPMAELLGRQDNVGFAYYGDRLKKMRRILHDSLGPNVVDSVWGELVNKISIKMIVGFLEMAEGTNGSRHDVHSFVQETVEELIVRLAYGRAPDEEYTALSRRIIHETGVALQPGRWLVNIVPALMHVPGWVPGAGFQKWAASARDAFYTLTRFPFQRVKSELAAGVALPSFVEHALENSPEQEDIIMCAAGSLYSAGNDTLSNVLLTFLLLMIHHPDVQERAYEEILTVCGPTDSSGINGPTTTERLPTLSDRPSLPYINAIIQEVHRFNPSIPLLTRSNIVHETFNEYNIPKGTWMMANIWGMLHDDSEYPSPMRFAPERFLAHRGKMISRDPTTVVYGFGRRICPGMHLANNFLFLVVAQTLATFKIVADPVTSLPPITFQTGLVPTPVPFKCALRPRSGVHEVLVNLQPEI